MKKRKFAALLLSFTMLASAVPAMAQTATDIAASQSEEQLDNDTARYERMEEYKSNFLTAKQLAREDEEISDDVSLMATSSNVTLSGSISLPSGVTAQQEGEIGITLYKLEKSGNKIVNNSNSSTTSQYITLKKGKSSVSYSISVPKGSYALAVDTYEVTGVLSTTEYYTANGNVQTLELADSIALTSNKSLNMTLSKPERTISGTITLDEAADCDGYIEISLEDDVNYKYYYSSLPVSKGQKTVSYSIGVPVGIYMLCAYSNYNAGYYSIYGDLGDYEEACYLDLTDKSLSNINFSQEYTADEFDDSETGSETGSQIIPVTLTVPNTVSYDRTYRVRLVTDDGVCPTDITIKANSKSGSASVYYVDSDFIVSISDVTNSPSSYDECKYYYSSDLGFTSNEDAADVFSLDTAKINLDLSDCLVLTGNVSRNNQKVGEALDVYVYAEFEDESFFDIVTIPYDSDSAEYSILIPNRLSGESCDVFAEIHNLSDSAGESETVTIGASAKANVSIASDLFTSVSGVVTLTQAAPTGGAALKIEGNNSTSTTYYVPEGTKTINYTANVAKGTTTLFVDLTSDDNEFNASASIEIDEVDSNDCTLRIKNKTVSGSIKIPEGLTLTNGVSYRVIANYEYSGSTSNYANLTYGTIMTGETEKSYSVSVPENTTLTAIYVNVVASGNMPFITDSVYYSDGSTTDDTELSLPIGNGLTGKDIELKTGRAVLGTITLPSGISLDDYYDCNIVLNNGSSKVFKYVDMYSNTKDYMIVVPDDFTGDFTLSYYVYSDNDLIYDDTLYYSTSGPTLSKAKATALNLDETSIITANLTVPKIAATINLTAHKPSYADTDTYLEPQVKIILDNGDELSAEPVIGVFDMESDVEEITIPSTAKSFKLCYSITANDTNYVYDYENMYVNSDGSATQDAEKATSYSVKNANIDFVVWDNSILVDKAIADENVALNVSDFSIDKENGTADAAITYTSNSAYGAACILAVYDADGTFVRMDFEPILLTVTNEGSKNISFDISDDSDNYVYKLFVWNNICRITPLTQALDPDDAE